MKKIVLFISFLLISIIQTNAYEINVKRDGSDSATYTTSLQNITNNGSVLNFKLFEFFPPTATGSYKISFPAGFEKVDQTTLPTNTCNGLTITEFSNSNFNYIQNPTNQACASDLQVDYKVTSNTTIGDQVISVLDKYNNILHSVNLGIISGNSLENAETIDSDKDGFIDGYKLTFLTGGISSFSNTNLKVGTLTPNLSGSVNNNIAYINFTDGIYNTGEIPDITDTDGGIFSGIAVINSSSVGETDKAAPIVKTVNGTTIPGVSNPTVNMNENSKLTIEFSEKVLSSSVISNFVIKENGTNITNSSYITFNENDGNTMYYCKGGYDGDGNCNTNFDSTKPYTIELGNNLQDWNSNIYTGGNINVNITVTDVTPPVGQNITYNGETNQGVLIRGLNGNNNYTKISDGSVTIDLLATDNSNTVDKYCLSETSLNSDNVCATGWQNYTTSVNKMLTGGEGVKQIFVKYKDTSSNISSVYSDTVIWDKTGPNSSANPGTGSYNNGSLNVTLNCNDSSSSCNKIYYTTNGSNPTTSSSFVSNGGTVSLNGSDNTIELKYFSEDIIGNLEASTKTSTYNFSNSYVTIDTNLNITNTGAITLNGTCNYATGLNNVEYRLNGGSYQDVNTDNCETTNTWSTDINLVANSSNTFDIRIKANTSLNSTKNIIQDNTAPNNLNLQINGGNTYSTSQNVNLTIGATDTNSISQMCISETSFTNDNFCPSSWENYNNSKSFILSSSDGTKTIYIKFRDAALNVSNIINDTIILDSTVPTVSANLSSGNHTGVKNVTLTTSGKDIYYTLDGTNPNNTKSLYSTPLSFGTNIGSVELKILAYSNGGLTSSIQTYNYNFGCFPSSVSNGSVAAYPSCSITCNSGYTQSGNSCVVKSSGGGGGGGGGSSTKDFESVHEISQKANLITDENLNKNSNLIGYINIKDNKDITKNAVINLRAGVKSYSNLKFLEDTKVISSGEKIYGPYSFDIIRDLKTKTLKINGGDFKAYNIKKLFFAGDPKNTIEFNKDIEVKLNLGSKITGKLYVFYAEKDSGDFKLIKKGLETDSKGIIKFNTNKLGYFAVIRDIYSSRINNFDGNSSNISGEIKESFSKTKENLISELKNKNLSTFVNKYSLKIENSKIGEYIKFNGELRNKYNNYVNNIINLVKSLDSITASNKSEKLEIVKNSLKVLNETNFENLDEIYVTKEFRGGNIVYRTKTEKYKEKLNVFENTIINKFDKLLNSQTITQEEYNNAIKNYNDFILYLTIYKKYKYKPIAYKALEVGKKFVKIYYLKIQTKKIIIENKKLVKNIFPISRNSLKIGDYNPSVENLQKVLKNYGYFTYPTTTQYFGNVTNNSFKNFANDILKVSYNGLVTQEMINKINNLELK